MVIIERGIIKNFMKKRLFTCYLVILVILVLYYLNLIFIDLDFWNRDLRNYSSFIPIVGFSVLFILSILLSKRNYYYILGIIIFFLLLICYLYILVVSLYFAHFEYKDEIIFSDNVVVEVYLDVSNDKIYFLKETRFLQIFSIEKCLFWYMPIKWDEGNIWKKEDDHTFSVLGISDEYALIDINEDISKTNCNCHNNNDIESSFCLFDREFRYATD